MQYFFYMFVCRCLFIAINLSSSAVGVKLSGDPFGMNPFEGRDCTSLSRVFKCLDFSADLPECVETDVGGE